jgi:hypothetical protein
MTTSLAVKNLLVAVAAQAPVSLSLEGFVG